MQTTHPNYHFKKAKIRILINGWGIIKKFDENVHCWVMVETHRCWWHLIFVCCSQFCQIFKQFSSFLSKFLYVVHNFVESHYPLQSPPPHTHTHSHIQTLFRFTINEGRGSGPKGKDQNLVAIFFVPQRPWSTLQWHQEKKSTLNCGCNRS